MDSYGCSIITLTSSESKRLISQGIVKLPEVQKAYSSGIIALPLCTTNAYIYEEITGKAFTAEERSLFCCGYIHSFGFCRTDIKKMQLKVVFVEKKENRLEFTQSMESFAKEMSSEDVVLKSGNVLDVNRKAGVLAGEPNGGDFGVLLPYILAKGIKLIVPMTLNKTCPTLIDDIVPEMGMEKIVSKISHGIAGMLPMPGKVFTEVEALALLAGVAAVPVAMNGVGSGEGCVTLLVKGEKTKLEETWDLVNTIKGEPALTPSPFCSSCSVIRGGLCPQR